MRSERRLIASYITRLRRRPYRQTETGDFLARTCDGPEAFLDSVPPQIGYAWTSVHASSHICHETSGISSDRLASGDATQARNLLARVTQLSPKVAEQVTAPVEFASLRAGPAQGVE
jgi:hypothetical protein